MRQWLLDLYEIQKIDLHIREQEKQQEAQKTGSQQLASLLKDLQVQIATLTDQHQAVSQESKSLYIMLQTESSQLRKWESRLGDIRNQREYQALSREIESARRAHRDSEEKLTQLNQSKIQIQQALDALQTQLSMQEKAYAEEQQRMQQALESLKAEVLAQYQRREALLPCIPTAMFRKYEAIRSHRLGIGLALVVDGYCTGCNIRLLPQLYNTLQRGDSVEQCPSCYRLILWNQILTHATAVASDTCDGADAALS